MHAFDAMITACITRVCVRAAPHCQIMYIDASRHIHALQQGGGGAVYTNGETTVLNSRFEGNTASDGGVLSLWGASVLKNSTFVNNSATNVCGMLPSFSFTTATCRLPMFWLAVWSCSALLRCACASECFEAIRHVCKPIAPVAPLMSRTAVVSTSTTTARPMSPLLTAHSAKTLPTTMAALGG